MLIDEAIQVFEKNIPALTPKGYSLSLVRGRMPQNMKAAGEYAMFSLVRGKWQSYGAFAEAWLFDGISTSGIIDRAKGLIQGMVFDLGEAERCLKKGVAVSAV